jgi:hypothetical protein
MAPPAAFIDLSSQNVLSEVLKALRRLEGSISGQDKRLLDIEQTIRSGSLSFRTSSEDSDLQGSSAESLFGQDQISLRIQQSPVTTPPSTPNADKADAGARQHKFDFEDSVYEQDGYSVASIYSFRMEEQPNVQVEANEASITIPPRSPLRVQHAGSSNDKLSHALQAQNRHLQAELLAIAYEEAPTGPEPSRIKPSEAYHRQCTRSKFQMGSMKPIGITLRIDFHFIQVSKEAVVTKVTSWTEQRKQSRAAKAAGRLTQPATTPSHSRVGFRKSSSNKVEVGESTFGAKGFWRCIILILSSTHRTRPYVAV